MALGAALVGVMLKPAPSDWCPELPSPAWVLLLEIGQGVGIAATVVATIPVLLCRHRRWALGGFWLIAVLGCVGITIARNVMIPTGCD